MYHNNMYRNDERKFIMVQVLLGSEACTVNSSPRPDSDITKGALNHLNSCRMPGAAFHSIFHATRSKFRYGNQRLPVQCLGKERRGRQD